MAGVADEIAAYLATEGLGLTVGENLWTEPFPLAATTDPAVCIDVYGGRQSDRSFGAGPSAPLAEYPHFHVFIRAALNGTTAAKALADAIYKALDNLGPTTLSGVVYRDVRSLDGPPKFLDYDGTQRAIFMLNFEADKDQS